VLFLTYMAYKHFQAKYPDSNQKKKWYDLGPFTSLTYYYYYYPSFINILI
jgi:hypothetical protein